MSKLCDCGCGELAPIAKYSHARRGWVLGQPKRFLPGHHRRRWRPDNFHTEDENGCWLWLGDICQQGYGRLTLNYKPVGAHRWVWERLRGPLEPGLLLHHLCEVRRCVNPDHLKPVSPLEHSAAHAATHCKRGHEYTPENAYVNPNRRRSGRSCRVCRRELILARKAEL